MKSSDFSPASSRQCRAKEMEQLGTWRQPGRRRRASISQRPPSTVAVAKHLPLLVVFVWKGAACTGFRGGLGVGREPGVSELGLEEGSMTVGQRG